MSEIVDFVKRGASTITPNVLAKMLRQLPLWKAEFSQVNDAKHPHLADQLMFLADAVEDFAEDAYQDLPFVAIAEAIFALTYAHKNVDIIPNSIADFGLADDSSIVRAVLIKNEKPFAQYAVTRGLDWTKITSQP